MSADVPVPRPKPWPDGKPGGSTSQPADKPAPDGIIKPVEKPKTEKPKPVVQPIPVFDPKAAKACEAKLRKLRARFTIGKDIVGKPPCGIRRPVLLTGIGGKHKVAVTGNPKLNCRATLALVRWIKNVVVPSGQLHLGERPGAVNISTSYHCRRRNNAATGKLSEHAFGNGIDIMGFRFEEHGGVPVKVRTGSDMPERAFQAAVRGGSCAYFTTVIGPSTNAAHADHFHFDVVQRRGGYRLCE